MRPVRPALELRMELTGQKERMVYAFDDFDQVLVRVDAADPDAPRLIQIAISVVTFAAMAVAFDRLGGAVNFGGQGAFFEFAGVIAEAHGAASHMFIDLVGHGNDYLVSGIGVEF